MNEHELENLERQLASRRLPGAPLELRSAVLDDVHRELTAARWDRWLARAASVLLIAGIGMNAALSVSPSGAVQQGGARVPNAESLAQVAATVAESTDAQTGRRFAIELATLAGWTLTREEFAAIDAAVTPKQLRGAVSQNEG